MSSQNEETQKKKEIKGRKSKWKKVVAKKVSRRES